MNSKSDADKAMTLSEIYEEGKRVLEEKDLTWTMDAVETGFVVRHDRRILDRYTFRTRYIDGVKAETGCNILGVKLSTPLIMSGITSPIHHIFDDGLMQVALGLKDVGSLMWVATPRPKNLEELVGTGVPIAVNVKPFEDRDKIYRELEKIQKAGVTWVGIETDAGQGTKVRDRQMSRGNAPLSLSELKDIRKKVSCPLICKGVLSRLDAEKCVEAGADGIVVTNHGGHTLDYLPHPLQVMDEIVDAVGGKTVIIVDSGFRRGSDVIKGLAFGASLVSLGRPIVWAVAAAGKDGVKSLISEIAVEMRRIMTLIGADSPGQCRRDMLIEDPPGTAVSDIQGMGRS